MNQLQIEQKQDTTDRKALLAEVYAATTMKVEEPMRVALKQILNNASDTELDEVLAEVVMITAIETNGAKLYKISKSNVNCDPEHPSAEYQNSRVINMEEFFQSVLGLPSLMNMFPEPAERFNIAILFSLTLQTTLYGVETNVKVQFENGWKTISRVVMYDILPPHLAEKLEYSFYNPPMQTQPLEWNEDENGGYLLKQDKITKGRGHARQPQAVCDALNVQQAMVWELNKYCTTAEEIQWVTEKSQLAIDESETEVYMSATRMAATTTASLVKTRELLEERNSFHFVWDYDYRGRSYCRAYNYNPQGDKYKKGAINAKANIH